MNFIFGGAKAIGLSERDSLLFELGVPVFPQSYPQSPAGSRFLMDAADERWQTRCRKPLAKQPPLHSDIGRRVVAASRARSRAKGRDQSLTTRSPFAIPFDREQLQQQQQQQQQQQVVQETAVTGQQLQLVWLHSFGKGVPEDFATVYAPTEQDLVAFHDLRRQQVPVNQKAAPERQSATTFGGREIIGYVTKGCFSFSAGKGRATAAIWSRYLPIDIVLVQNMADQHAFFLSLS